MGIRCFGSYKATVKTPRTPREYTKIQIDISQNGTVLFTQTLSGNSRPTGETITVQLTQQQTGNFIPGDPAYLQVRCFASAYDAPASRIWPLDVWPSLTSNILT